MYIHLFQTKEGKKERKKEIFLCFKKYPVHRLFTSKTAVYLLVADFLFQSPGVWFSSLESTSWQRSAEAVRCKSYCSVASKFWSSYRYVEAVILEIFQNSVLYFLSYLEWMTCAVDSAISQIFVLVCLFGIEGDNALFFLFSFTNKLNISICFLGMLCYFTILFSASGLRGGVGRQLVHLLYEFYWVLQRFWSIHIV